MRVALAALVLVMLAASARAECEGPLSSNPRTLEIVDCINYLLERLAAEPGEAAKPRPPEAPASALYETTASGIRAAVASAGRSGQDLTIALTLTNLTDQDLGIALIGPPPQAVLGGTSYELRAFSGAAQCRSLSAQSARTCMTFSGQGTAIPPDNYTRLTPGSTTALTYAFRTRDRNPSGHIASFASTFSLLSHDSANQPTLTSLGIGIPGIPGIDLSSFP